MPDITMCATASCPLRGGCYRALAEPGRWQSYSSFAGGMGCTHFVPAEGVEGSEGHAERHALYSELRDNLGNLGPDYADDVRDLLARFDVILRSVELPAPRCRQDERVQGDAADVGRHDDEQRDEQSGGTAGLDGSARDRLAAHGAPPGDLCTVVSDSGRVK